MRILFRLFTLASAAAVLFVAATAFEVWRASKQDDRSVRDAIVVMGAAQYNGKPSPVFKARLDHALELYRQQVAPLVVVLGGKQEGDRATEAQAGAAYLEERLPADRVTGVKAGATTLDSLRKFTGLAKDRGIDSIVIVSDPFHLARARAIAKDLGFETTVSASRLPTSESLRRESLINETGRLLYYRILGEG
ncbi:MAG: YdcF family protein [Actinomycetota bacterium]